MSKLPQSLIQTLTRTLLLIFSIAFLLGTGISIYVVQSEYDELLDVALITKAQLMLPLLSAEQSLPDGSPLHDFSQIAGLNVEEDEKAVFWLVDENDKVLRQSDYMNPGLDPTKVTKPAYSTLDGYRFFVTQSDPFGYRLKIGESLTERNEAALDSLLGQGFSMATLVLIAFVVMRRSIGQVQSSVINLSNEIGQKDERNLSPIDPSTSFKEMVPAVETINALMARLEKAVETERSFATNAAHELRTPLAVSLAHTQRLMAATKDPNLVDRAKEIELGLKKLIHLVERLLQFSRAQSGLGTSTQKTDANIVIRLVFSELTRGESPANGFNVTMPEGEFLSAIDPDALAILLSNLIDNAKKHSTGDAAIELDASEPGVVVIANDCEALSPSDLAKIQTRYVRKSTSIDGYGIGLAIARSLCDQSGASLNIMSPRANSDRGFATVLTLP
jgi:two-component system OmpR family sensor kinase